MTAPILVRPAVAADVDRLTEIAHTAKAHWGYPAQWIELWRSDLTFDAEHLENEWVQVAESGELPMAVVSVGGEPPTLQLSHLWVMPATMGRGLGRGLFRLAVDYARTRGADSLEIVSDPYAEEFYIHLGAIRIGEIESEPAGRRLPHLSFEL